MVHENTHDPIVQSTQAWPITAISGLIPLAPHLLQQLFHFPLLSLFLCLVRVSLQGIEIGLTSTCRGADVC